MSIYQTEKYLHVSGQTLWDSLVRDLGKSLCQIDRASLGWEAWLRKYFLDYVPAPFASRHIQFWEWVEGIRLGRRPVPLVAIWPRGGAKSTSVELAIMRVGAKQVRGYVWYCCGTQEQADKHVETVSLLLESRTLASDYPLLVQRQVTKYGHSRGWRRSRLWTASGLTVDAVGLDVAARGAKVQQRRPDFIVFDDVDDKLDSPKTTKRKMELITTSILPAGSADCAVLFVQNLIRRDSVAWQLVHGEADFLADKIVSGPHVAVEGLEYEQVDDGTYRITAGDATWEGQGIQVCQNQINTWGPSAFRQEAQHEVDLLLGGIWNHIEFRHCKREDVPDLVRGCVWVDPVVTSTDQSGSQGIQADGIDANGVIYRFFSWEQKTTPTNALKKAILKALELGVEKVGVETDQGGDLWIQAYRTAWDELVRDGLVTPGAQMPKYASAKAGTVKGTKVHRNQEMLADYERGRIVHVLGTHDILERALRRFPAVEPYDLVDASFWSWYDLRRGALDWTDLRGLGKVEGYESRWG